MTLSFEEILNFDSNEVERPKPLPKGTYATIIKNYEQGTSPQKGTPFIQFNLQIQGPLDDVDQDEITAFGAVAGKMIRATFWFNEANLERSRYFLSKFLDAAKVDPGQTVDRIEASINCQVGALTRHKPNDDGEIYSEFVRGVEL